MRAAQRCPPPLPFMYIEVSIAGSASMFARIALRGNCVFCECGQVAAVEYGTCGGD